MSGILISYGAWGSNGLEDAASEAKDVSKKLSSYSDALNDDVYKKLNRYRGTHTGNITSALSNIKGKMDDLDNASDKYITLQDDLNDLRSTCKQVDGDVAKRVESLTADFKERNNIKTSVFDGINSFLTNIMNKTSIGRWINDTLDKFSDGVDDFFQMIEDWFDFQGGEAFVKGVMIASLEIVAAVAGIVAAVATLIAGGTLLAMVAAAAALVGGVIALVNGVTNLVNEHRAIAAYEDDPARAKRLSDENKIQDVMRKETTSNIAAWDMGAGAIDTVKLVCDVIGIVKGGADLFKNLKTWAGSDGIFKALGSTIKDAGSEIKTSFANRDFGIVKDAFSNMFTNFKEGMFKFDSVKDGAKSIKSMASLSKDAINDVTNVFSGDAEFGDIAKNIFNNTIANFSIGEFMKDGELEKIKIDDFSSIVFDTFDGGGDLIKLFSSGTSAIDISLPDIAIPDIDIRVSAPTIDLTITLPTIDVALAVA